MKRMYLGRWTSASGNQDQDHQRLLNKTDTWNMAPLAQRDNQPYQRLSDDLSRPPQSQPQGGNGPDHDGYLSSPVASGDQADGFGIRTASGVSERSWRKGTAD